MSYKVKILRQTGVAPAHRGHIAILTLCCSCTGNLDTSVSGRFIKSFLHLFFRFIRRTDQSEPIEHPVDVSHSPDIAQSFRSFNYFSYLFNIAQSQQHRTPRQAFTVFSTIDPQFLCVLPIPALSYFIWLLPIRNTVNTRLFGACKPEKIIFDLSHYAKSRPAWETGGFFAWIDGKEAQK